VTLNQIGESARKTVRVQALSMAVGVCHLALVSLLLWLGRLSVSMLFWLIIGEYILAALWSFRFLGGNNVVAADAEPVSFRGMLKDFTGYCKPLVFMAWAAFLYEFADRWMLQRFGGSGQQGFYQIAYQFSAVSLLATSSILNVFWKEIAEAHGRGDAERVAVVYHKVNRGLVMFGAILSGFLIPWTDQIVAVFLGQAYTMAGPVLMIMFLYPIHQSMGQIGGTMLLASGYTHSVMVISVVMMVVGLPLSYLAQAPATGFLIPGLGLGAMGMAIKMVLVNMVSVNVQAWVIARKNKWKYNWSYQVIGIGATVGLGFASKYLAGMVWDLGVPASKLSLILPFLAAGLIYLALVGGLLWMIPWLIGMSREEMAGYLDKVKFAR
jgi:O-antigen/teichoic acid export membrane protein